MISATLGSVVYKWSRWGCYLNLHIELRQKGGHGQTQYGKYCHDFQILNEGFKCKTEAGLGRVVLVGLEVKRSGEEAHQMHAPLMHLGPPLEALMEALMEALHQII